MTLRTAPPRSSVSLVAAVGAFGLPDAPTLPSSPLEPSRWARLVGKVRRERIEGLLAAAVHAGALPTRDEQFVELREAVRGRARTDLCLEREMLAACRTLGEAAISYRVLKGHAWAHTIYPDPAWRGFGDVDLLVADDDWYRAVEALEESGARRVLPELRPGFDRRFGKDATLLSAGGSEIDLHRTLVVGPYGFWIDRQELFDRAGHLTIGGVEVPILDPEASFLHACYNAAVADDPPRVIAARDVCQMVLTGAGDPDRIWDLAGRWRGRSVVIRALSLASDTFGVDLWYYPVAAPFATARFAASDRVLMASYRGRARGYTSQAAGVVALPGIPQKLSYLAALARPQRAYLDARSLSPAGHLRRALRFAWERP